LSGAIQTNGKTVASKAARRSYRWWALVCPVILVGGELARTAARFVTMVQAIYAVGSGRDLSAGVRRSRIDQLIETGLSYVPADSLVTRLSTMSGFGAAQDGTGA